MKAIGSFFKNYWNNWVAVYYEIDNWRYVKKIIRKHRETADWERFGLRADWIARIYTVMNPELPGDKGDTKEVLKIKYSERLKPMNLYLDRIGLSQSVTVAYEDIPDSDSLLIVYVPIFESLTIWKVIRTIGFWIIFFSTKLDTYTWEGLSWLWTAVF